VTLRSEIEDILREHVAAHTSLEATVNAVMRVPALALARVEGWRDGVREYATWRDGEQLVGCMETPLGKVLERGPCGAVPESQRAFAALSLLETPMPDEIRSEFPWDEEDAHVRSCAGCANEGHPYVRSTCRACRGIVLASRADRNEHGSRVAPSGDAGGQGAGGKVNTPSDPITYHSAAASPEPSEHARRSVSPTPGDVGMLAEHAVNAAVRAAVREFAERVCQHLDEEDARIVRGEADRA